MFGKSRQKRIGERNFDIAPDEIFLDSENLPNYDTDQFEGRLEKPIKINTILILLIIFIILGITYLGKIFSLQIINGQTYALTSENNRLRNTLIFSDRGIIYDRNNIPLAWNIPKNEDEDYNLRKYIGTLGFANLLGYIKYPQKDSSGFYYSEDFVGIGGVEEIFSNILSGKNGIQLIETNALNEIVSENTVRPPEKGESIVLTIDSRLQEKLHYFIAETANDVGFDGGGGVIMDVETGEIIALTTYPEFDSNILTTGSDKEKINNILNDPKNPFLNRVVSGLYTPGSIIKPYIALGALTEGVINQSTVIVSNGSIELPNPYDPDNPSIFNDWKSHGPLTIRDALAYSSNVFFYEVGGGFKDQRGIGIKNIEKYTRLFGFGEEVSGDFFRGQSGTIPNPEWKAKNFDGDPWRVGDTYYTSIGQYGFQVTPLQVVRAVSAIANGGTLINPKLIVGEETKVIRKINEISDQNFKLVQEGMRNVVLFGTGKGLNMTDVAIAAKTGTAELGVSKSKVNSWVTGFFPYEKPKYAFVVVMEKGNAGNLIGGVAVARKLFDWMKWNTPLYFAI